MSRVKWTDSWNLSITLSILQRCQNGFKNNHRKSSNYKIFLNSRNWIYFTNIPYFKIFIPSLLRKIRTIHLYFSSIASFLTRKSQTWYSTPSFKNMIKPRKWMECNKMVRKQRECLRRGKNQQLKWKYRPK